MASNVGTGKTPVAISAIKQMPGVRNVLIVCPLSVAPTWRTHLAEMGDGGKRWCVINYEGAKRLLTSPAKAAAAKKTRTKNLHIARQGKPKVTWDVVLTDESHYMTNPEAQRTRMIERVIANPSGTKAAFVMRMSATAGSNPAQLSYLHRGLAWRSGETVRPLITAEQYVEWCETRGIHVRSGRFGNSLTWERNGSDLKKVNLLLFSGSPRWAIRRVPDWPEQQRIPIPIELDTEEMDAYEAEWATFKHTMKDIEAAREARAKKRMSAKERARAEARDRASGLAAMTRYRQKAGQIRASYTADFAADMVHKGHQVAVSCEYLETAHKITETLASQKITAVEFTGENPNTREEDRIAFQRGEAQAIVFTPAEGFSLHAGEATSGASDAPRVTVVAEPRWSPKKALQVEGRSQRDGTEAPCYYAYAVGTVEEKVIRTVLAGMRDTSQINGDDSKPFDGLASTLGVNLVAV